jgi:hypothetical protein
MKISIDINAIATDTLNAARRDLVARVATACLEPLRRALEDKLLAAATGAATIDQATRQVVATAQAAMTAIDASPPTSASIDVSLPAAPYVTASRSQGATVAATMAPPAAPVSEPGSPPPFYPRAAKGGSCSDPGAIMPPPPPPPAIIPAPAVSRPVAAEASAAAVPPAPVLAASTSSLPGADVDVAGWGHDVDKAWKKYLQKEGFQEDELCRTAAYPVKCPDGFRQPLEIFHAVARALPDTLAGKISVYDIAARANVPPRQVLFALTHMVSSQVLHRQRATASRPALICLPPPSADDPARDLKARFIEGWRTPPGAVDSSGQPVVAAK